MKKILEKFVKYLLTASGFITSFIILLIIFFLFSEGAGLFKNHIIDDGYVLALNKNNPVNTLSAKQVKGILVVELNSGQMIEDVKLAVECNVDVKHYGRLGGIVPTPEEVLDALKEQFAIGK